jgi:hypothetical protein
MEFVERPRRDVDVTVQTFLTDSQVKSMKQKLKDSGNMQLELYAMLSVSTMARVNAISNISWKQIDFDTAFLNGLLQEVVYMLQPEGFEIGDPIMRICKLIKSIYGLKQAARVWYKSINKLLNELGWKASLVDPCLYSKRSKTGNLMFMSLYVDDSGIAYKKCDEEEWLSDKEQIAKTYKIKDIGDMHWMLHMKISRDRKNKTITISQEAYVEITP